MLLLHQQAAKFIYTHLCINPSKKLKIKKEADRFETASFLFIPLLQFLSGLHIRGTMLLSFMVR